MQDKFKFHMHHTQVLYSTRFQANRQNDQRFRIGPKTKIYEKPTNQIPKMSPTPYTSRSSSSMRHPPHNLHNLETGRVQGGGGGFHTFITNMVYNTFIRCVNYIRLKYLCWPIDAHKQKTHIRKKTFAPNSMPPCFTVACCKMT